MKQSVLFEKRKAPGKAKKGTGTSWDLVAPGLSLGALQNVA